MGNKTNICCTYNMLQKCVTVNLKKIWDTYEAISGLKKKTFLLKICEANGIMFIVLWLTNGFIEAICQLFTYLFIGKFNLFIFFSSRI